MIINQIAIGQTSLPQLNTPSISIEGTELTITNPATNGNFANGYKIYANGEYVTTYAADVVDLLDYIDEAGSYSITVKCVGTNFFDSNASESATLVVKPKLTAPTQSLDGVDMTFTLDDDTDTLYIKSSGVTVHTVTRLAKPTGLSITGTTLSWTAVSNATSYKVFLDGDLFDTVETNSCDLSDITDAGEYELTVQALAGGYLSSPMSEAKEYEVVVVVPYLTFQSENPFTISVASPKWDGTMEYSTDTENWTTWNGSEIASVDGKVYLRGTGNTRVSANSTGQDSQFLITGTAVECVGNIETLLDWQTVVDGQHPEMDDYCFTFAFGDCSALIAAPSLPSTTLANSCYHSMFRGCINLTTAPALPATTLAEYCYRSMFEGCTSLTTAPALPAATLANFCYHSMFRDCINLTTAPALPATTLANSCYQYMFYDCTSLTTAPVLPATTLASGCYGSMFNGCTSLTIAPSLPATTLANGCYGSMFSGCTSLTTAPELPATTLAGSCYSSMFYRCTSLAAAPALPATTLEGACYSSMFDSCTALTAAPSLPATTLANNCYRYMFYDCTNLKISTTQTDIYQHEWRIPTEGTISSAPPGWNTDMFYNTGGTFTGNPTINTTYYVENQPVA